jgi:hypothetical protein
VARVELVNLVKFYIGVLGRTDRARHSPVGPRQTADAVAPTPTTLQLVWEMWTGSASGTRGSPSGSRVGEPLGRDVS